MVMTKDGRQARVRRRGLRAAAAQARERAIDGLVEQAEREGGCTDRFFWTLHYDIELAPVTTNARQLQEVGVELPAADSFHEESGLHRHLWEVIETLADLGVYLMHTDHLADRELYRLLEERILRESVRDLPPSEGVAEFIDLGVWASPDAPAVADRDRLLPKPEQPPTPKHEQD
jgi:hypothetical protein